MRPVGGVTLCNSMGTAWTADYLKITGGLGVDLRHNIAAEARAKIGTLATNCRILKHPGTATSIVCVPIQPTCLPEANKWRVSVLQTRQSRRQRLAFHQLKPSETMADGRI